MTEKTPQPILLRSEDVEGVPKIFVGQAWPSITTATFAQLTALPEGLATLDGDDLSIACANGTAKYLKTETAEDGTFTFELVESTFEPLPDQADPIEKASSAVADLVQACAALTEAASGLETPPAPAEDPPVDLELDTDMAEHTDYVREPRKTFGQVLSAETAAAFKSGDMTLHASIHNFEIASGDFKRAAILLVATLPKESELRDVLESIISDL